MQILVKYDENTDRAKLKKCSRFVWLDEIERILKKRKVGCLSAEIHLIE